MPMSNCLYSCNIAQIKQTKYYYHSMRCQCMNYLVYNFNDWQNLGVIYFNCGIYSLAK